VGTASPVSLQLEYSIDGGAGKYGWNIGGSGLTYSPAFPIFFEGRHIA
jgi:hypothetical protein